jgi:hypothetical protein
MLRNRMTRTALAIAVVTLATRPLEGQDAPGSGDPGMMAAQMAAPMMKSWLTKAGELMSEGDFAYRPTPDVRSFSRTSRT